VVTWELGLIYRFSPIFQGTCHVLRFETVSRVANEKMPVDRSRVVKISRSEALSSDSHAVRLRELWSAFRNWAQKARKVPENRREESSSRASSLHSEPAESTTLRNSPNIPVFPYRPLFTSDTRSQHGARRLSVPLSLSLFFQFAPRKFIHASLSLNLYLFLYTHYLWWQGVCSL